MEKQDLPSESESMSDKTDENETCTAHSSHKKLFKKKDTGF